MRKIIAASAVALMAAGLFATTAVGSATPTPSKGGGGITENEWLRINNPAHNSSGFGDTLNEVEGIVGHPGYSGEKWMQGGRMQWKRYYPPSQCPGGNTLVQFEEFTNAWRVADFGGAKWQICWDGITNNYPYPDN